MSCSRNIHRSLERLHHIINRTNESGAGAQLIELLPSMQEAVGLVPVLYNQKWWYTLVTLAQEKGKQEDQKFKVTFHRTFRLSWVTWEQCLKKKISSTDKPTQCQHATEISGGFSRRHPVFTSLHLLIRLATMSWIMPRLFPSVDMDLRRVSMASWLALPSRDSPFTAMSWSFTLSLPSCEEGRESQYCWLVCKRDCSSLSLNN